MAAVNQVYIKHNVQWKQSQIYALNSVFEKNSHCSTFAWFVFHSAKKHIILEYWVT